MLYRNKKLIRQRKDENPSSTLVAAGAQQRAACQRQKEEADEIRLGRNALAARTKIGDDTPKRQADRNKPGDEEEQAKRFRHDQSISGRRFTHADRSI